MTVSISKPLTLQIDKFFFSESCKCLLATAKAVLKNIEEQTEEMKEYVSAITVGVKLDDWHKNKVKQFNSIRKYLNPTLAALVRMEMFANHDDQKYKHRADEKRLSKELHTLSPTVYEFMKNEWNFALPDKDLIAQWNDDDEELL